MCSDSLGWTLSTKALLAMSSVSRRRDQASSSSQCFASWEQGLAHTCHTQAQCEFLTQQTPLLGWQLRTFSLVSCPQLSTETPSDLLHDLVYGAGEFQDTPLSGEP